MNSSLHWLVESKPFIKYYWSVQKLILLIDFSIWKTLSLSLSTGCKIMKRFKNIGQSDILKGSRSISKRKY